ncbi:unnamed protein product [Gemmata massiliana]|uniref:Uncharacterized protein n=1 Tax=Gemmata massiliana TaxID=1210884 RepID=A0A6P2CZI7_9BACT|nr:hypothetical protein [Gemmata massiliana]VTR94263.1 unnamed protein product [Gemmata massiliana]
MFKSVKYVGFDGRPELEATAKQLTPVLANEIRQRQQDVEVAWTPLPSDPDQSLSLTLARTVNGVEGAALGTFAPSDLVEAWLVRSRCRAVWSDLLEDLSQRLGARVHEALSEPLEV